VLGLLHGMRSGDKVADALGRTVRYSKITRRERQAISQASTLIEVPAGTMLARQGAPGHEFVIVLTGAATVLTGNRVTSALLAGDHFGDVALLDNGTNPMSVVAETAMRLAVVGRTEFGSLLDRCPSVARAVLNTLAGRLRAA
jgi:CRP/FNR family cyclic AMP-dependent transcriptional regulator